MRYIVKAERDWDAKADEYLSKTVYDREPLDTGLYDRDGKKIFKVMGPVGFLHREDR